MKRVKSKPKEKDREVPVSSKNADPWELLRLALPTCLSCWHLRAQLAAVGSRTCNPEVQMSRAPLAGAMGDVTDHQSERREVLGEWPTITHRA